MAIPAMNLDLNTQDRKLPAGYDQSTLVNLHSNIALQFLKDVNPSAALYTSYTSNTAYYERQDQSGSESEAKKKIDRLNTDAKVLLRNFTQEQLINSYRLIGHISGRQQRRWLWTRDPELGAQILLGFASKETDIERLAEISELLASQAEASSDSLQDLIENVTKLNARPEYYESLLRAIRWTERPLNTDRQRTLLTALNNLAQSTDADVREAAYEVAIKLDKNDALSFLHTQLRNEDVEDARSIIQDAINELNS